MKKKNKGGRKSAYSDAYKFRIALEYLNTDKSQREVGDEYGKTGSFVSSCVRLYMLKEKQTLLQAEELAVSEEESSDTVSEVTRLKSQVSGLLLRLEASETMIDTAEEEFNISIRKKPGSRQSKS